MYVLTGLVSAALLAFATYQLIEHETRCRLRAAEEGGDVDLMLPESSVAASMTFLLGILAPFFLYRARGWRGALEGVALLFVIPIGVQVLYVAAVLSLRLAGG